MVVTRVADGIPAYVVKNNRTGKKKVVHQARLLLWLADYGEPVRCDHVDISDIPPGTVMDRYPEEVCESDNPVPGCSLQYGMDLTVYLAVLEDPEQMSSRIGCEVHTGAPQNVAGQMIVIPDGMKHAQSAWALMRKTFRVVEVWAPAGSHLGPFQSTQILGGK